MADNLVFIDIYFWPLLIYTFSTENALLLQRYNVKSIQRKFFHFFVVFTEIEN